MLPTEDRESVPAVDVRDLTVRFGDVVAVRDVTFRVRLGERVGLIGANGSGKSTLLRTLAGARRRYEGTVRIQGLRGRSVSAKAHTGFLPEQTEGFADLTIESLVRLSASAHHMDKRESQKATQKILNELRLDEWSSTRLRELSRGLRQRAVLAQCLVHRPSVLLLDEPSANLDMASREILRHKMQNPDRLGQTLVVSSHDWYDLAQYATRFLFMRDGVIHQLENLAVRRGYELLEFGDPGKLVQVLGAAGYETELKGHVIRVFGAESQERLISDLGLDPSNPGLLIRPYIDISPGKRGL